MMTMMNPYRWWQFRRRRRAAAYSSLDVMSALWASAVAGPEQLIDYLSRFTGQLPEATGTGVGGAREPYETVVIAATHKTKSSILLVACLPVGEELDEELMGELGSIAATEHGVELAVLLNGARDAEGRLSRAAALLDSKLVGDLLGGMDLNLTGGTISREVTDGASG